MATLNMRPAPIAFTRRVTAALAAGIAVALVTHIATVFAYYIVNGASGENLAPINAYFVPSSLVLFVLASLAASLGAHRWVTTAAIAGVVAGVIAFWLGTGWGYVQAGGQWGADAGAYAASALVGPGTFFVAASAFVMVLVGGRVWSAVLRATAPTRRSIALVRTPSSRLAEGELTHLERTPVDLALADEQWQDYLEALESEGFETVEVPVADEHPDSVFIEDAIVVFGDVAVITRPGAESRRGETEAVHATVAELGFAVRSIEAPGTLEGGDVLKVGTTVYVGRSSRTNAEGIRQLRAIVTPLGYDVVAVPVKKTLHLKSAVSALPDGTVVGHAKLVDAPTLFPRFLALPEPGAIVLVLSDEAVLMSTSTPKSSALVDDLGYRVVTVDIGEFEKLEGCVTCLSVRLR